MQRKVDCNKETLLKATDITLACRFEVQVIITLDGGSLLGNSFMWSLCRVTVRRLRSTEGENLNF